ncbi:hypothetical protein L1049_013592 [Liquidambar formosana]|uniref:Zinc finger BED domain-containing protein RICESLEEPER 2-like n=1 Tax=Liquidambar formosana TaxID=63359 RepID=A0AAP0WYC4_LIQFO
MHQLLMLLLLFLGSQGTSTLKRHLLKCPRYPNNQDHKQKLLDFQSMSQNQGNVSNWKFDQELCRKELARMIIVDELPFSFVEKEGFKRFISVLQPRFNLVSRTTMTKDCIEIYLNERNMLKEIFVTAASRVCLTTDLWTSIQNLGYMCLTAHYIDKGWNLQKRIINFRVVPTPHRGEIIAQAVETCLLGWGLEKLCTITVDNASSNDTAAISLVKRFNKRNGLLLDGEFFHVRCFAHILNLVVRDGINEVKDSLIRLRDSVKYVRSSPSRTEVFKKCAAEERIVSKKSLCLDVPTRWNSTYLMLNAAIEYEKAFDRLEEQDSSFIFEMKEGVMRPSDWLTMKNLHMFLEHFYIVTIRISGSKYITSNSYFKEMNDIQKTLLKWSQDENTLFRDMAKKMYAKFEKYCNIGKVNMILIIAMVLDPRYKLKYVKFSYTKFYDSSKVDEIIAKVKSVMDRLYHCYMLEMNSNVDSSQSFKDVEMGNAEHAVVIEDDWDDFLKSEKCMVMSTELDRYLEEGVEICVPGFDILLWWKVKSPTYPVLSCMARDILAIPITTVASESAFSTGGRVLDQFRSSLTPKIVECLICAQDWLRCSPTPIEIEEKLEILEDIETRISDDFNNLSIGDSIVTT